MQLYTLFIIKLIKYFVFFLFNFDDDFKIKTYFNKNKSYIIFEITHNEEAMRLSNIFSRILHLIYICVLIVYKIYNSLYSQGDEREI